MKIVFGILGTLMATLATFVFAGFGVTYALIFFSFSGPESVVEPSFEVGFSCGLICALVVGFLIGRYFWIKYSSGEPE